MKSCQNECFFFFKTQYTGRIRSVRVDVPLRFSKAQHALKISSCVSPRHVYSKLSQTLSGVLVTADTLVYTRTYIRGCQSCRLLVSYMPEEKKNIYIIIYIHILCREKETGDLSHSIQTWWINKIWGSIVWLGNNRQRHIALLLLQSELQVQLLMLLQMYHLQCATETSCAKWCESITTSTTSEPLLRAFTWNKTSDDAPSGKKIQKLKK